MGKEKEEHFGGVKSRQDQQDMVHDCGVEGGRRTQWMSSVASVEVACCGTGMYIESAK